MVKVEVKNNKVGLQGDFIFEKIRGVIKENDGSFSKEIRFRFNPESIPNLSDFIDEKSLNEIIGEKLKQDFIKFLSNE
jgi:hypothetical protein